MAFLLLLNTVARAFHLEIDNALYNDIVMAVLGVVTVLGFVQKDGFEFVDESDIDKSTKTSGIEGEESKVEKNSETENKDSKLVENFGIEDKIEKSIKVSRNKIEFDEPEKKD